MTNRPMHEVIVRRKPITLPPQATVQDACAEIKTVHHRVDRDHHRDEPEPEHFHGAISSVPVSGGNGSMRHFPQDQEDGEEAVRPDPRHEMVPSDLISTPRAISRCESTGRVGKIRSMIIRT